ncbi:hypothetical protein QFC19_006333 [Naganishia cerealis]|uniref:Uncharacterized protein n=1 Tax=Naganishia cerealis TaxID=610337 RepID=A0ACC2VHB1_9TREE|nr:hypothetical protein QFC19_006333 [Naganishia cerealis]
MKGPDSVSRRSSGQTLNPQVQVNESDRSAHAITSDQSKSSAYHSVNHRQVAHKDSGPSIQIPTSVSDPASLSTSQLSAFVGTQQKLNQTEFNINSTDTHGQLISLSKTIEQLAKTQAEMFVWLQTEMSRRKIWEEQCLHEIRQRNLHATSAAQPSSHNGLSILSSNGIIASPSVAGNVNTDGTLGNLSSENLPFHKANGNNRGNSLANEIQQTFMHRAMHVQVNGDSSYPHSATDSHPSSATLGSVTNLQMATPEHDLVTVPALMTHMNDDTSDRQRQIFPNDGLNAPPSIPVSGGDANTLDLLIQQTGTGYQASVLAPDEVSKPIASDEVSKKRKRPRTDSSIDSERAGKRFAVNERGVVYMAGGSTKAMQTPTKIQVSFGLVLRVPCLAPKVG